LKFPMTIHNERERVAEPLFPTECALHSRAVFYRAM
jgi:hypothetical protein